MINRDGSRASYLLRVVPLVSFSRPARSSVLGSSSRAARSNPSCPRSKIKDNLAREHRDLSYSHSLATSIIFLPSSLSLFRYELCRETVEFQRELLSLCCQNEHFVREAGETRSLSNIVFYSVPELAQSIRKVHKAGKKGIG